jgi:peptidoglycan-N-acetylglucosamine deacetylase
VRDGHELANHSQYHHNLTRIPPSEYSNEILRCFSYIERVYRDAGMKPNNTKLFRPPGGGLNREAMAFLQQHDVTLAWWSNNVGDWSRPPAWKIANEVTATMKPGDIILLHDGGSGTAQALFSIAREARRQNLQFKPMPEHRP